MKRIKITFLALLLLLTALWLAADTPMPAPFNYFSFRSVFVQFSGFFAVSLMSIALLLALRPQWLEPHMGGLDKMYRLHKWVGIGALVIALLHWWWAKGTKWMVGWGWLVKPAKKPGVGEPLGTIEGWLRTQRGFAEAIGEWAFYLVLVLIVLALVKRFPYHHFVKTHKWLAAAWLALAYHAIVLTKTAYWTQPVGWVLAILLASGVAAAVQALSGRIGADRKVHGRITALTDYPALRVLETTVTLDQGWRGHTAGQFAFVTTDKREGPHPYTIASAWHPAEQRLTFITKALGDHTRRLRDHLKIGMPVIVEGPYGCFDFVDDATHQIWIGAGIGITPFIARLKQRAIAPEAKGVDLFHPTADFDRDAIDRLSADATAAAVTLHVLVDSKNGHLNGERIRATVPEWQSSSIWFCGPTGLGKALRDDLLAHGLPPQRFHQELFQMR